MMYYTDSGTADNSLLGSSGIQEDQIGSVVTGSSGKRRVDVICLLNGWINKVIMAVRMEAVHDFKDMDFPYQELSACDCS